MIEGTAEAPEAPPLATNRGSGVTRLIWLMPQWRSSMPPVWPDFDSAEAALMVAASKLASGSVWQATSGGQTEGASTIHSAELVSSTEAFTVLVKERWRVRSSSDRCTWLTETATLARRRSPRLTISCVV